MFFLNYYQAFGAVEALADRMFHSNGKIIPHTSADDLLACWGFWCGFGCSGGWPPSAWRFFENTGVVTSGQYGSEQGCQPYEIKPCEHHITGHLKPCSGSESTPTCRYQCREGSYIINHCWILYANQISRVQIW